LQEGRRPTTSQREKYLATSSKENLISDFQLPDGENINLCCSSHPFCGIFGSPSELIYTPHTLQIRKLRHMEAKDCVQLLPK
jgi:hypothetical protein